MEEICRRGNMVRISLGEDFVRYGYLTETRFAMRGKTSIEYTLTFFLISENKPEQNPIIDGRQTLPRDLSAEMQKINDGLAANMLVYPDGYPMDIFDKINAVVSGVSAEVKKVTSLVDSIISTGEKTSAALNRAVSLVASVRSYVHKQAQRIAIIKLDQGVREATLAEGTNYKLTERAYPGIQKQNVTSGYRSVMSTIDTQRRMDSLQVVLMKISDQLQAYIDSVSITRHLVKTDETLQQISVKYYGNVDGWSRIYSHNKLTSTTLTPGTILEIPRT
jgi:nucleoid-associated protein YgaU